MKINLLIFLALLVSMQLHAQNHKISKGDLMFDFTWQDKNGESTQLSDFNGKYVLLNFTANFCGPCWMAYPEINDLQTKYKDELTVISFHMDDDIEQWNTIAKKRNLSFDCMSVWNCNNKKEIADAYDVIGFPYFVLINKKGIVVKKWFGHRKNKLRKVARRKIK